MTRVSIVTPCYKAAPWIERTVASVQAQSLAEWEHIVVDDGSPDETADLVARLARSDSRIRLIRQPNQGVCSARNAGAAAIAADSEYLLFLDQDDCLEANMIEIMVGHLDRHPDVGMVGCESQVVDADDRVVGAHRSTRYIPGGLLVREIPPTHLETPFLSIFAFNFLSASRVVIRRSAYERTSGWDETLGQGPEDDDLFMQISLRSRVEFLPLPLVRYRRHDSQATMALTNVWHKRTRGLYAKWRNMQIPDPDERESIRRAAYFREGRLMPYLWALWGTGSLRRGDVVEAAKCYGRGVRQIMRYAAARRWAL